MADKAALFGVNEYKNVSSLRGCVNDVEDMKALLTEVFGFDPRNVKTFVDGDVTKAEVQRQMKWLFRGASEGDRVVLHLSSHGSNVADKDGDEPDGQDEIFCMHDMDFDDPGSYLLDDDLREWTEELPEGVQLLVVLDTCHSGTGTRLLLSRDALNAPPTLVEVESTLKRAMTASGDGERGIDAATRALRLDGPELVRARYVEPPPEVQAEIAAARAKAAKSRRRGLVKAPLNHVLLAACRDDQTAADATINGRPCGAFTHNLCQTIRADGVGVSRRTLIDQVAKALADGHFNQVPQLEAKDGDIPLFEDATPQAPTGAATLPATATGGSSPKASGEAVDALELLARIVGDGSALDAQARSRALDVYSRIVPAAPGALAIGRGAPPRVLITVHGICRHDAGYSNPWWDALRPYTNVYGQGGLGETRFEVLWSQLVNQRGIAHRGLRELRDPDEIDQAAFAASVRAVLEERTVSEALAQDPSPAAARDVAALTREGQRALSIPGINCVDDFAVYMFNDSVRAAVIACFTDVVGRHLRDGSAIDIISHSWGTVVAYEGLRELESTFSTPLIHNFFTVGSALSLFPVRWRLRSANRDGRKPRNVRRWINLDAQGDPVGGPLKGQPFQVDEEDLDLPSMGCGRFDASCAHSSYFKLDNVRVNRDIFARNINAG